MPDKHLLTQISHISLLTDASKKKEVEIEAKGEISPFLIYSVKIMSLAEPTWVSLCSVQGMVSSGTASQPACNNQSSPAFISKSISDRRMEQKESSFGGTGFSLLHAWTSKWLHLPKAPSEEGLQAATPVHKLIFIWGPHKV